MEQVLPAEYNSLSTEQCSILIAFWSKEKGKIVASLKKTSCFNNNLNGLTWRVDLKSASKHNTGIDEPIAFFELGTTTVSDEQKITKFEMTTHEVKNMVDVLTEISTKFDEILNE